MSREILSWIKGSILRIEAEEKNGATAERRRRWDSCLMVPNMESCPPKAWDQVGGLSRFEGAPVNKTS